MSGGADPGLRDGDRKILAPTLGGIKLQGEASKPEPIIIVPIPTCHFVCNGVVLAQDAPCHNAQQYHSQCGKEGGAAWADPYPSSCASPNVAAASSSAAFLRNMDDSWLVFLLCRHRVSLQSCYRNLPVATTTWDSFCAQLHITLMLVAQVRTKL